MTARLAIKKADNDTSDHIMFYNGDERVGEIGCHDDSWLRINQSTVKNVYTPRMFRADGGFQVDNKWVVSSDGNTLYENSVPLSDKYVSTTSSQAWHETNPITINTISNGKKSIKFNYADGTSSDTIFTIGSFTAEQWDTSGNLNQHIHYNTGNVGIGTTPSEANKLEVDGNVKLSGVTEAFGTHTSNIPSGGATLICDASSNKLFRISSGTISGDWTIMVTNLNLEFREATNLTFVVESGSGTSYIPSVFKIGSSTQEVKWQGGSTPTGTVGTEPVDIYSFTVFCTATDTYTVLGNHVSFDK